MSPRLGKGRRTGQRSGVQVRKELLPLLLTEAVLARFESKLGPPDARGCRLWLRARSRSGYGRFPIGDDEVFAHIAAWMIANNCEVPAGAEVHHECRTAACAEPGHLALRDSHREHMERDHADGPPTAEQYRARLEAHMRGEWIEPLVGDAGVKYLAWVFIVACEELLGQSWARIFAGASTTKEVKSLRLLLDSYGERVATRALVHMVQYWDRYRVWGVREYSLWGGLFDRDGGPARAPRRPQPLTDKIMVTAAAEFAKKIDAELDAARAEAEAQRRAWAEYAQRRRDREVQDRARAELAAAYDRFAREYPDEWAEMGPFRRRSEEVAERGRGLLAQDSAIAHRALDRLALDEG